MKKIGIDARLYSQTGVGVYIRNLLYYLNRLDSDDYLIYVYLMNDDFPKVSFTKKNFIKVKANYYWHTVNEQMGFLKKINDDKLDLMHFTYFSFPIFYAGKYMSTIHDLTPIHFKTGKASTKNRLVYEFKHLAFKHILKTQVINSSKIITPTATVKKQLLSYFGEKYGNKIDYIYEGISHEFFQAKENPILHNELGGKFFIYVGNFYPHKNVENLIKAFAQIKKSDHSLILIGPDDFFVARLHRLIQELGLEKKIKFHHNQSISDLVFFYKNAQALIHPSLSEGFGLPIIESMYFNLPIIASNIDVFRETLGNKYVSFTPKDIHDISTKINVFIENKPKFDYKGILKKFSFEKMSSRTFQNYQLILKG